MLKIEANLEADGVGVVTEVDGIGRDILIEGVAVVESITDTVAKMDERAVPIFVRHVLETFRGRMEKTERKNENYS